MNLFHDEQRDIPNLEFSPSHASIGFSQIAFPITVLPQDDRTDFAQEEQLGLPYWTMVLTISVFFFNEERNQQYDPKETRDKKEPTTFTQGTANGGDH